MKKLNFLKIRKRRLSRLTVPVEEMIVMLMMKTLKNLRKYYNLRTFNSGLLIENKKLLRSHNHNKYLFRKMNNFLDINYKER